MKTIKHIIRMVSLLLTLVFLSCLFFGCQQSVNSTSETSYLKGEGQNPVKLTFYFQGTENNNTKNVLDEIQKKILPALNITLDFKWAGYYQEYYNNIKTLLNSGNTFDAFYSGSAVGVIRDNDIQEDSVLDLTNLLPQNAPNLYKQYSKEEIIAAMYNGKLVGIPSHMQYSKRLCAIVREDFLKKYNITDINTLEDYETYLKAISENEKGITPMSLS